MTASNKQYYTSYPVGAGLSVGNHLTNVTGDTTTPTAYHNQHHQYSQHQHQIHHHNQTTTYHNLNSHHHHHLPTQHHHHYNNQLNHHNHQEQQYQHQQQAHQQQNQYQTTHGQTTLTLEYQLTVNSNQVQEQQLTKTISPNSMISTSPNDTTQTTNLYTTIEVTKSTKGASKLRRDLITKELIQLKQLLPLPTSIRDKLSQLNLMALVLVYVRKSNYFNSGKFKLDHIIIID